MFTINMRNMFFFSSKGHSVVFSHYLCLAVVSLEEELLEPEEQQQDQSRKMNAQPGLGYLGVRRTGPLGVTEMGCFSLNWVTMKPRDWGRPEVQKALWAMGFWTELKPGLGC